MSRVCNLSVATPSSRLTDTLALVSSYHCVAYASLCIRTPRIYTVGYPSEREDDVACFSTFFFLASSPTFESVGSKGPTRAQPRRNIAILSPYQRRIRLDGNKASIKGQRLLASSTRVDLRFSKECEIVGEWEIDFSVHPFSFEEEIEFGQWRNLGFGDFWNSCSGDVNLIKR